MVGSTVEQRADMFAVPFFEDTSWPEYMPANDEEIPADERVRRFQERDASPEAIELAGYLAAAPLSLPVMRLVQHAMLPASGPEHLAEVFLSGLLVQAEPSVAGEDPDAVIYEFRDGVRELLLGGLTQRESLRVLDVLKGVSGTIAERFGGTLDFRALVSGATTAGAYPLRAESRPFARVAATVLRGLGGIYGDVARVLTEGTANDRDATATAGDSPQSEITSDELVPQAAPSGFDRDLSDESTSIPVPMPGLTTVRDWPVGHQEGWPSGIVAQIGTRFAQPMMFIGLGGTGCQIGVELERTLRDGLCGPDGTDLLRQLPGGNLLPFQLPPFLQFVYADQNEAELLRAKRQVVVSEQHLIAAAQTEHFVHKLVPRYRTYPEVARSLRANASEETKDLAAAGQTASRGSHRSCSERGSCRLLAGPACSRRFRSGAGRACCRRWTTRSGGLPSRPASSPRWAAGWSRAATSSSRSRWRAAPVPGSSMTSCTWSGTPWPGQGFDEQIYPLVLMPSAFDEGLGRRSAGGAQRGPALLDLFRLIDDQQHDGARIRLARRRSAGRSPYATRASGISRFPRPRHRQPSCSAGLPAWSARTCTVRWSRSCSR